MIYKYSALIKVINVLVDFLILNLSFLVALFIYQPDSLNTGMDANDRLNFLIFNLVWFYCASLQDLYKDINIADFLCDDFDRFDVLIFTTWFLVQIARPFPRDFCFVPAFLENILPVIAKVQAEILDGVQENCARWRGTGWDEPISVPECESSPRLQN
jgi:hypothetical protein